jgi:type IV secretory pathway VirB6-like protein
VDVTGQDLTGALTETAEGFSNVAGTGGEIAANMLLLALIAIMLFAGLMLWFVLVLRKIAILVVVAFAPLLIAGYLWEPTRGWVRRATEVLIALIFTKTAIYALFGIGLASAIWSARQFWSPAPALHR